MSETILAELHQAKMEKQLAAERAENNLEREHQQRLWEAGELRTNVIEPALEVAGRLEGLLGVIGVEKTDTYVPRPNRSNVHVDEYFVEPRAKQYPVETDAMINTTSLVVDLGRIPDSNQGVGHAVAQLFTKHKQTYVGVPTIISRLKSKRDYQISEHGSPILWHVGLEVSTVSGDESEEGDLLKDDLFLLPYNIAASRDDERLANESDLRTFRGQESRFSVIGSLLTLIQKRKDENPANILAPDELTVYPYSFHLSEC